ncbi:MAG: hypothetical protein HOC71_19030 [Candidatus Latescibacteria bacterium]|jgi:hypothetical protein|nr:hypothetical protein [Candidatus Latescibacterota bacterium]
MFHRLLELLKLTPAYSIYRFLQHRKTYKEWEREGIPIPPPPVVKQHVVCAYARRFSCDTIVETGTYLGEMVYSVKDVFDRLYSIEIDRTLARKAQKRFSKYDRITILQGDSGEVLREILAEITTPCLFWLDSHYSGGLTSKGEFDTPVMQELTHIFNHDVRDYVVLIDDARCFTGENDYPELNDLREFVLAKKPGWSFEVEYDIIRIHKK